MIIQVGVQFFKLAKEFFFATEIVIVQIVSSEAKYFVTILNKKDQLG